MNDKILAAKAAEKAELIKKNNQTLAIAESCTGGWLSKIFTDVSGISAIYKGGVCSYSNEIKMKILGVKEETLDCFGAVSSQTAREMAEGVRRLSGADFALSVTGISGPGGGSEDKPVGLAYIGFAHEGGTTVKELRTGRKENSRDYNRYVTASTALHMLVEYLNGRDGEYD